MIRETATRKPGGRAVSRVLAVASGKGGAGKTSVAVNLAFALGRAGRKVCLLDADLGLSNVDVVLGISPALTLEHVLFDGQPMERAIVPVGLGVDVVSGASGVQRMAELSRPARRRLVAEFAKLSAYDYVLVDNSPGISRQVVSLCLGCDEILVVVNPEPASITDAYALVKVLRENGLVKSPWLVFNRVQRETQAREVYGRFRAACAKHLNLACRYLGAVPQDAALGLAASRQRPLLEAAPTSRASLAFAALARSLEAGEPLRPASAHPGDFFERSMVRLLEHPEAAPAGSDRDAPVPPGEARAVLELLNQALDLLAAPDQADSAAAVRNILEAARSILAGTASGRNALPRAATGADGLTVAVLSSDPTLRDVLEEALTVSGMAVSRPDPAATNLGPGVQVLVVASADRERADRLTAGRRVPLVLVDGFGRGWVGEGDGAVEVVAAPLRLDRLVEAVRRSGKGRAE